MTWTGALFLLLLAAAAGTAGQAIVGYTTGGCLASIALGFVGALLGGWIADQFGLAEPIPVRVGGQEFRLVWSVIGATLFVAFMSVLSGRRRR